MKQMRLNKVLKLKERDATRATCILFDCTFLVWQLFKKKAKQSPEKARKPGDRAINSEIISFSWHHHTMSGLGII